MSAPATPTRSSTALASPAGRRSRGSRRGRSPAIGRTSRVRWTSSRRWPAYAFVAPRGLAMVGAPSPTVVLRNPLREDQSVMRTSLLPGLLHVLSRARRHGERDAQLFSVGALFLASGQDPAQERLAFAALLAGARPAWLGKAQAVDVWDAKGIAGGLVARLTRRDAVADRPSADQRPAHLHPRGAAWITVDGARVGSLGPIHPGVADAFDLGEGVIVVEIDLDALDGLGARPTTFD